VVDVVDARKIPAGETSAGVEEADAEEEDKVAVAEETVSMSLKYMLTKLTWQDFLSTPSSLAVSLKDS
jgi:hypothetical protein